MSSSEVSFHVDERGYYGDFGGAFIPEMLYPNVEELRENYLKIMEDPSFQAEFNALLKDYVGRPTPLFKAERLSAKYKTNIGENLFYKPIILKFRFPSTIGLLKTKDTLYTIRPVKLSHHGFYPVKSLGGPV